MTQRVSRWDAFFDNQYADQRAINQNAEELDAVQTDVEKLSKLVRRQADDLLLMRAFVIGIVEVLHVKAPFDQAELDAAVSAAYARLTAPPPAPTLNVPKSRMRDERPVTCAKCGKSVPAYRTNITADGEVCDACG
ncbi:MAG TPA: hypothetical protein VH143_10365 [Kofleriaceae bacterium]|jgi:hypothetical protein|nr:hypothetical protein [Kofleriaceae bacterium]